MAEETMTKDAEPALTQNALHTLRARYLRKDASGRIVETPGELFWRVAKSVAAAEKTYLTAKKEVRQIEDAFYAAMTQGKFLPNSPTLMNAGRRPGVLSACFVLPVEDSIDGIFESVKDAARIQKAGGGTGFSFDRLRPTGDYIASSGGRTSGPISFWKVFSEATRAIQQGAFRRGANMGMMSVDQPDVLKFIVLKFITAKKNLKEFENFNISIKVSDDFLHRLRAQGDEPHVVTNPRTQERYLLPRNLDIARYELDDLVPASESPSRDCYTHRDIWETIVQSAWASGEPGLCFIDRVNNDNPTPDLGRIEATNPCGEQPLLDYEACNLGSVNLAKFAESGRLDEDALREAIRLGVRFLDDVIDVNDYMIPPIAERCKGNRKIGIGFMGLADAMFSLGIKYDSDEGVAFGRRLAEILKDEALGASEALATQRGTFPNWRGSLWDTRYKRSMRNAAVTTIAPTGTLSILAACSGGIEPVYALAFFHRILGGRELLEISEPFRRYAERKGFWNDKLARTLAEGTNLAEIKGVDEEARELFVTAHDIAPIWSVKMQAAFQESIDGAISKTINLPNSATPRDVDEIYQLAYDLKCKGVTVYRDGCREHQPMILESAGKDCPQCRQPLAPEIGCTRCPHCGAALCAL
ncbi:MAG: adenosylcobalamin-dependent ribonucleoside-diphosphate reductase [Planctomycetota bacterium]